MALAAGTHLDRSVAIKILPTMPRLPTRASAFEREARIISQLSHPHICARFDVGHHAATDFLVMQLRRAAFTSDELGRQEQEISRQRASAGKSTAADGRAQLDEP